MQTTTRRLAEEYTKETKEDWQRHLDEVVKTSKDYRSLTTKESSSTKNAQHDEKYTEATKKDATEAAESHKAAQNQSVTTTFQVAQTWTYSVPVINARVVSGDAEVSATAFGPDPSETPAPAPVPAAAP